RRAAFSDISGALIKGALQMAEAIVEMSRPGALSPADLHPLPEVKYASKEEVLQAVAAARAVQPAWAAMAREAREAAVLNICRRLLEKRAEGVKLLSEETGRGELECLMSELVGAVEFGKAAIRASRKALARENIGLSKL